MRSLFLIISYAFVLAAFVVAVPGMAQAQTASPTPTVAEEEIEATSSALIDGEEFPAVSTPAPMPRIDITQSTEETRGRLETLLDEQELGSVLPTNFLKYSLRATIDAGVPANTIVLLLLLPLVVAVIAAARHVVGLRGFGIFLPASLAIVFVAIGPIVGIGLFLVIVLISTFARLVLRKLKVKLQYLPRMAIILWFVVVGVLLALMAAPLIRHPDFTNVSIFPVLILVLLAEDFSKVQLGKSARTAVTLASETVILALVSYIFLTMESLQAFALLHPEAALLAVVVFNLVIGRYAGLRFMEYWRYRRLIMGDKRQ